MAKLRASGPDILKLCNYQELPIGAVAIGIVPVVDIVRGEKTSDETVELTYRLMLKLGKKPVRLLKEVPGFLLNRLQFALYREALY